jgi:elongation factor P
MLAKDIKPGVLVVYSDAPCLVKEISVQSPSARGAATLYKYRALNLLTKQKADFVLKGGESLPEADFEKRLVKLMYADPTQTHFLDQEDFNQFSLDNADVKTEVAYITEATESVYVLIYNGEPIGIQVPLTVELKVTQCDPGVRGNSATSRTKPATLETGLIVQVPEYLSEGETVKVDTRTGEYLSRV